MKKPTMIAAITALTLSFSGVAKAQEWHFDENYDVDRLSVAGAAKAQEDQSDGQYMEGWQYMRGGKVPAEIFQAIYNRCTQLGSNAYQANFFGGYNFSMAGAGTMAGISTALGNLQTAFRSQAAQDTTFNDCMAQHGFYPR